MFEFKSLNEISSRITDGSHFSPTPQPYGYPIANVKDMRDRHIDIDSCTRIKEDDYRALIANGCTIKDGDVLLSKDGTVGKVIVYTQATEIAALSSICIIKPNSAANPRYLGHVLRSSICARQYENFMSGSALRRLVLRDIKNIQIPLPENCEQQGIAAILDTLDDAIEKSEALIAKLKQVRTGMLHDLLTCGVDENGEIRDPDQHPERFRASEIGRIPHSWTVSSLGANLTLQRGFDITVAEQRPGKVPVVSSSGITSYHDKAMVAGPGVVTGRKGKLGNTYYIDCPFWPHDTTLWVNDFHENLPKFAAIFLEFFRLERFDAATSVPTLNRNTVHPLLVAFPPGYEQEAIVTRIEECDEHISSEKTTLAKLISIKSGLSADLLTGQVRVPPDLELP